MPKAQVISFINMKGGVGKTTCAVNLATYLAKEHAKRVLLVDLDPQTNASLSVMSEKAWEKWQEHHGTMADVLEVQWKKKNAEHAKLKDCIISDVLPEVPGLDLVPSHLSLTFLDLDLAARPGRERIFGRKLEKVRDEYDLILCDCAPNLMTGTQNALYASDWYCIPMQPDFLSSIGLGLLQDRLGYLKKELEFKIRCLGIIFTRVRHWLRYHQETMERLRAEKSLQRLHFFDTFIPENIKLAEAPMESRPIALHDASATGAEAFKTLTAEFLARLGK
ncbi:MAG: chromosome partitioning protein [Chthoniobacter sp.]|jgi:chromosome partitioning protein|nr:chromosome partitioning protein [Chthoniobacter sp.]